MAFSRSTCLPNEAAIVQWLRQGATQQRHEKLMGGYRHWRARFTGNPPKYPGTAYTLLHSLSHALMVEIALDCGYPASSLKERVYALSSTGDGITDRCGILIYTATAGAQGTLGGLVGAAPRLDSVQRTRALSHLLQRSRVCRPRARQP
jgi:hypothetical protein